MTTGTLEQIQADTDALDALLYEEGGEVTPETEEIIAAWFAELGERTRAKVDGYAFRIKAAKAEADAARAMADELEAKAKTLEARAKWLTDRMAAHMKASGEQEMKGDIYRFAFQANGGVRPLVLTSEDPADFPEDCRRVTVEIDRNKVREQIEQGNTTLPAYVGPRGVSLRIR